MKRNKKGFTLVELVIVIAVIAILAAVLLPTFASIIEQAKESTANQMAENAKREFITRHCETPEQMAGVKLQVKVDKKYYVYNVEDDMSLEKIESNGSNLESNGKLIITAAYRYEDLASTTSSSNYTRVYMTEEQFQTVKSGNAVGNWDLDRAPCAILTNGNVISLLDINSYRSQVKELYIDADSPNFFGVSGYYYDNPNQTSSYNALEKVVIQEGVTELAQNAFSHCRNLQHVYMADSVTKINSRAFYCCTSLFDLKISQNLVDVGECAFQKCISLTEIVLPDSLKVIGKAMFSCCTSLVNLTLPREVQLINECSFEGTKIAQIVLPATVYHVKYQSFSSSLKTVYYGGTKQQFKELVKPWDWRSQTFRFDNDTIICTNGTINNFQGSIYS